jgi:selenocysteine lyase/cysteine desulfurase
VDLEQFRLLLEKFRYRKTKIAAITACSNVTGIETPYGKIAKMIHDYNGLCFVDFACSAPYVQIDMHPPGTGSYLDAIYFSPHKFLGGPGTPGVLIFNKKIYPNRVPDQPGGGTLLYSNPWCGREYITDIEQREDGGTPPILQGIKAAMCIRLKEQMGTNNMLKREAEILKLAFARLAQMDNVQVLAADSQQRLGVIAFIVKGGHYNLVVKLLNDRFGIQARGGCSCAGTYGHHLLQVDKKTSCSILHAIRRGDLSAKPGWVRISFHPTMTNAEIDFLMDAIELTAGHFRDWAKDYHYDPGTNGYFFKGERGEEDESVGEWFEPGGWD